MNEADCKAWCAAHGINTYAITDEHGNPQIMVDIDAMRQIADSMPDPARAHAALDQLLAKAAAADDDT